MIFVGIIYFLYGMILNINFGRNNFFVINGDSDIKSIKNSRNEWIYVYMVFIEELYYEEFIERYLNSFISINV